MNIEIKGVHCEITDRIRTYVDSKIPRLDFAQDLITDFLLHITKEKRLHKLEVTMNFRWSRSTHLGVEGYNLYKSIDILFDKLEEKIQREKSKIQEHRKKEAGAPEAE